mmetsp:Transcript_97916/g.224541  ORF Transcript_97916/g.224541 Transcript_97916/m.224541 type:complete len:147 (+) Transcript_97916:84-524(+)
MNALGMSAIAEAAVAGDVEACREILAEDWCDVNIRDFFRRSPLIHAAMGGHLEVVEVLVEAGADLHCKDRAGWTALHWAAFEADASMVAKLLALGADENMEDFSGKAPRQVAVIASKGRQSYRKDFSGVHRLLPLEDAPAVPAIAA